jgi:hypothetical protein
VTTEKRIDDDIYYALTSLKLGICWLVKPEDLISSESSSDLEKARYIIKRGMALEAIRTDTHTYIHTLSCTHSITST